MIFLPRIWFRYNNIVVQILHDVTICLAILHNSTDSLFIWRLLVRFLRWKNKLEKMNIFSGFLCNFVWTTLDSPYKSHWTAYRRRWRLATWSTQTIEDSRSQCREAEPSARRPFQIESVVMAREREKDEKIVIMKLDNLRIRRWLIISRIVYTFGSSR